MIAAIVRCDAEIADALATHHEAAYKITIWELDWRAEKRLIEEEESLAL